MIDQRLQLGPFSHQQREVDQTRADVKQLEQKRVDLVGALPEHQALEEARAAVEAAKARLKIAVCDNRDLAKLDVESPRPDSTYGTCGRSCRTPSSCTRSRPAKL
jgi:hypothetical protein